MWVKRMRNLADQIRIESGTDYKSGIRQLSDMVYLAATTRMRPIEYRLYGMNRSDVTRARMRQFMSHHYFKYRYRPSVNSGRWKEVLDNKWLFHMYYGTLHIPIPEALGYFSADAGLTVDGSPLTSSGDLLRLIQEVRPDGLVIKPVGGMQGRGVLIFDYVEIDGHDVSFQTADGKTLSLTDVVQMLGRNDDGYLIERRLSQHESLLVINPYTMNTARIVTFKTTSGDVDIHFTVLRLGRKGNMTDNWDAGGISVRIDPDTGVLGSGVLKPKHGLKWLDVHPDTGTSFKGCRLPFWREAKTICEQAAKVTPQLRSVGWDVAFTPSGPVIIEGNPDWDLEMVQVHFGGYLERYYSYEATH